MYRLMADPLFILFAGVLTVVLMITVMKVNAFLSLLTAALCVSFLTPLKEGEFWDVNVKDVGNAFGLMTGNVGILIAMGAIIGKCMLDSGAAEKIIEAIQNFFGKKLLPAALLSSGFLLSIPVFYDATFYLLVPIARSLYNLTKKNCILYLMTIGLGATLSHTLIPPTPGPVAVAETLNIPLGSMLIVSLSVGILTAPFALGIAILMNWTLPNPVVRYDINSDINQNESEQSKKTETETKRPSLFWSFVPILLPIVLIANQTTLQMLETAGTLVWQEHYILLKNLFRLLGDPRFALILSAVAAMTILFSVKKLTLRRLSNRMESALADAGMIILITAAGGAFGEMLRRADVGGRIGELFHNEDGLTGITLLFAAFCIAAIIKTAQGSSTTAMITTAGMFKGILVSSLAAELPFNAAYLAVAIGLGSCVTGWMNDSGFWIFCRMGGIKESDALRTWTVGLVLLGVSGMLVVSILSQILPLKMLP